jgi:hypothetical protein
VANPPGEHVPAKQAAGGAPRAAGPVLAAGVTFLVFLPSVLADYVYDDLSLIAQNPYARSLGYLGRAFKTHLWDVYAYGSAGIGLRYYRPLVVASYILNWWASGGAPWAFHLANVLCHAMATFLATRIATRWTGSSALGLAAGLLFGLHPSRTESVVWISGRTDVFMALFTLLAVEFAHEAARASRRRGVALGVGAVLAMVASVLSKEGGILTALFVSVDFLLAPAGTRQRRLLFRMLLVQGALGVAYLGLRTVWYPVRRGAPLDPTFGYGLYTVWAYVERLVFPWPQTFFYRPVEARGGLPHYPVLLLALGALVSLGCGWLLARSWKRDRPAFALLLTAFALLGPLLNFSYTGIYVTTSDHFLYLPLFVGAAGVFRLYRQELLRIQDVRAVRLLFAGGLAIYAGIDGVRVFDYRNDEAFWQHELDVNPDNPVALQDVSRILARRGELEDARELLRRALLPTSTRFFLLAGSKGARMAARVRLLGLEASLRPDGDVVALGRLFVGLDETWGKLRELEVETAQKLGAEDPSVRGNAEASPEGGRWNTVAVDAALVGTRIGRLRRSKELVDEAPDDLLWHMTSPPNFVLALARLGDFARARRLLSEARHPPPGIAPCATNAVLDDLEQRVMRAEGFMRSAEQKPDRVGRLTATALGFAELGAYLQALRVLRPEFDRTPHAGEIDPLYVQLLVSARLDREASRVATALLGPERGRTAVAQMTEQLPPRLRTLSPAPEPSPWWHPEGNGP